MNNATVHPAEWLTNDGLTEQGSRVRGEYENYCGYLDVMNSRTHMSARAKYHLQLQNYWTLPDGYALPPHTINVCVNNVCNLRCRYCDFGQRSDDTFYYQYNVVDRAKKIELSLETCKSIVDQAAWFKPIIRASFREPLIYPHILDFVAYTKQAGLPFWLLTNGFNLDKCAAELARLNVDSVRLSLDGPEAIHDDIRGVKHSYKRMMDGVREMIAAMKKHGAATQIGFYFTINDYNSNNLIDTVEALQSEGVLKDVFLSFQWLLYTTKEMAIEHNKLHGEICGGTVQESTVQAVDIWKMDLKAMSEQANEIARRFPEKDGYRIHFRPSFDYEDLKRYRDTENYPLDNPRCQVPWYNMNINPEGEVKTFHHCLLPVAGNIKESSIMDIWNGDSLREQRLKLKEYGAYKGCARCWGLYAPMEDRRRKGGE